MKCRKGIALLMAILMCFQIMPSVFAASYGSDEIENGMIVQPEDALTFSPNVISAGFTAVWGVRVIFQDYDETELQNELINVDDDTTGKTIVPASPKRDGYKFVGWKRTDSTTGTATLNDNGTVTNINGPGPIVFTAQYENYKGMISLTKKTEGKLSQHAAFVNKEYTFTITKDGKVPAGKYKIYKTKNKRWENEKSIKDADGKVKLQANDHVLFTELEPGEYLIKEEAPQKVGWNENNSYKSTSYTVNGKNVSDGLEVPVTVTEPQETTTTGGWTMENGQITQDEDGYFTYTITADQMSDDGRTFKVNCDPLAEYMEYAMRNKLNFSQADFKVKFVNETGVELYFDDYEFDTQNWLSTGDTYVSTTKPEMKNTNDDADEYSAGYGWGEAWQKYYPTIMGESANAATLNVKGFDGSNVRMPMVPLRCINPAILSYFKMNPGYGTLTGNETTTTASDITLLQMNAFPELIKESFEFLNCKGFPQRLDADENRTYADFLCIFYDVDSLDELTNAQKYNILGTGHSGSPNIDKDGQAAITTYYSNKAGNAENWCIPYSKLNDGTLDYFKTWGISERRVEAGKKLYNGGAVFSDEDAETYAYQPTYYIMESDPEVIAMAYEYLYERCIRITLNTKNRKITTTNDNATDPPDYVSSIKDYIDKETKADKNIDSAFRGIDNGKSLTLDNIAGFIEVPNAWSLFNYFDFGFNVTFKAAEYTDNPRAVNVVCTNLYKDYRSKTVVCLLATGEERESFPVQIVQNGSGGININGKYGVYGYHTSGTSDGEVTDPEGDVIFTNNVANLGLKRYQVINLTETPYNGLAVNADDNLGDGWTVEILYNGYPKDTYYDEWLEAGEELSSAAWIFYIQKGDLQVSNTVEGNAGDKNKEFSYTVTLSDNSVNGTFGDMTFENGVANFTLKHGETKTATGVVVAKSMTSDMITYTVEQTDANKGGYVTSSTGAVTGNFIGGDTVYANFKNVLKTGTLVVNNTVGGNAGDKTKDFNFTVTLGDTSVNGTFGDMTFVNGVANFTLKHGESKTAENLPAGVTYAVVESEANREGYVTTSVKDTGTVTEGETVTAEFVNTRRDGTLVVSNTVTGNAGDTTKEFNYTVTLGDTSINGTFGDMTFVNGVATFALKHSETKTAENLPADITYTVVETEANQDGYTTTVVGDAGTVPETETASAEFTNTKKDGILTVTNTVTGNAGDTTKDFNFTVTLGDTSINGTFGDMTFVNGVATFTLKHEGSKTATGLPIDITYTVVETEANQDGYTTTVVGDTGTITEGETAKAEFTNTKSRSTGGGSSSSSYGTLKILKTDSADEKVYLAGAKFEVYNSSNKLIGTYTTDKSGQITVNKLTKGTYYAVETVAPDGYELNSEKHEFTITARNTTTLNISNKKKEVTEDKPNETPDDKPTSRPPVTTQVPSMLNGDDHFAYIIGRDDGLAHPETPITRAEVTTIFFRLLKPEVRNGNLSSENGFDDVEVGDWYNAAVSTMSKLGIIKGRTNTGFEPDDFITRAEFAAIAARFDTSSVGELANFSDIDAHWAKDEISKAAANGWVNGYEDGTFRPDQNITRAEAMALINRVLNRIPETTDDLLDGMVKWPDNADVSKWYYLDVQEATNSHDYNRKESGFEAWTKISDVPDWIHYEQ